MAGATPDLLPSQPQSVTASWPDRCEQLALLSRDYNCDSTTIRLYHDAFDYDGSDRNYDLRSIRLRYDYDPTIRRIARLLPFHASK